MVIAQSLVLLATDTAMLVLALMASHVHNSPSLFNSPASPDRQPHPLVSQMETELASMPNRYLMRVTLEHYILSKLYHLAIPYSSK